jgi:hypothetical protein
MDAYGLPPDSLLGQALRDSAARRRESAVAPSHGRPTAAYRGPPEPEHRRASASHRGRSVAPPLRSAPREAQLHLVEARHGVQRAAPVSPERARGAERGRAARSPAPSQRQRPRSPVRAERRAPPRAVADAAPAGKAAARSREPQAVRRDTEKRRERVVAPPPKSAAVLAAQAVLQSLGFSSAYEAFVALDEHSTNAVSMAELRKGLRVLKIEQPDEVLVEIRSFRALLAHHSDTVDGRTFFGVLDWSQPARGFSHRTLNAAYRRRPHILETFRQNLPTLLRERARRDEARRLRELVPVATMSLTVADVDETNAPRYHRPASPPRASPARVRAVGAAAAATSSPYARVLEEGLIDALRSATEQDGTNPYSPGAAQAVSLAPQSAASVTIALVVAQNILLTETLSPGRLTAQLIETSKGLALRHWPPGRLSCVRTSSRQLPRRRTRAWVRSCGYSVSSAIMGGWFTTAWRGYRTCWC